MTQFYSSDIAISKSLPPDESAHAVRVLRMKEGDSIEVVDGKGTRYSCIITHASSSCVTVDILNEETQENPWRGKIVLAVAPTKNSDRMEWLVEKCVEMGIDEIVLIECSRSERRKMKTERLERIMISAMKQSLKTMLPQLRGPIAFADFIGESHEGEKYLAWCGDGVEKKSMFCEYTPEADVTILIGPEGDFTSEEVKKAIEEGFRPISLGESRLRTETAAMFAVAGVHTINQKINDR